MRWNKPSTAKAARLWSAALFLVLVLALAVVALAPYGGTPDGLWRSARCVLAKHEALWPSYRFEGFFNTSTVEQRLFLEEMDNCQIRYDDSKVAYVSLRDPGKLGTLRVTINKDFDDYVFFRAYRRGRRFS